VVHEHKIGRDVPLNTRAIVMQDLLIASDRRFDINVPMVSLRGEFRLQGEPFPAVPVENARIHLRDHANGALTPLGETRTRRSAGFSSRAGITPCTTGPSVT
jgi:hypothetical protein